MYSSHAKKYDIATQNNVYNALFERPSFQALLGDVTDCKILDLGSGPGTYAKYLLDHGAKSVTCIDFSEQMIEIVKSKLGDQVIAYTQDLSIGLPCEKTCSLDIIICPLVLHYLEDLTFIFKECYRVLKPKGYMVFSTHHPFSDFKYSSNSIFELFVT